MTHKFDKDVVEDNLSQGMGGLPAAEAMGCEITTHTCGITLIIGKGEGTIADHSWWGLGNNHNITVNADKILGDLSEGNDVPSPSTWIRQVKPSLPIPESHHGSTAKQP